MPMQIPAYISDQIERPDTSPRATPPAGPTVQPVEAGTVTARALLEVWRGLPALSIDAPPGAGKTALITTLAANLAAADLRVGIAANTTAQVAAIANRIAEESPSISVRVADSSKGSIDKTALAATIKYERSTIKSPDAGDIVLSTTAKWGFWSGPEEIYDVLFVDEARQATWASFARCAQIASQYVLVGDPGQIGPLVSTDTTMFAGRNDNPSLSAPDVLTKTCPDDVRVLRMPTTRRLGQNTVDVIAPLYPFTFTSDRSPTTITTATGVPLAELVTLTANDTSPTGDNLMDETARRAVELAATTTTNWKGAHPTDVLVVVAHRQQVAAVTSRLQAHTPAPGLRGAILVDTFDAAQGLEADAVVSLDPLAGMAECHDHSTDTGRLCVALSRHGAHLSFVTTTTVMDMLRHAHDDEASAALALNIEVRQRLANCQLTT